MTSDSQLLLEKAARSLEVAEDLLQQGHWDFATSRAYYAFFYTAQALLVSKSLEFSSHSQVISQYGLHFSKTRVLSPDHHRWLIKAFDLRNLADYQIEVAIGSDVIGDLIQGGRRFLEDASRYLDEPSGKTEGCDGGAH